MARRNAEVWFWHGGDLPNVSSEARGRQAAKSFWQPRADLIEGRDHYYFKVELAGVRGEDVQLLYLPDSHSMLIRGVRREESFFEIEPTGCHLLEIYFGEFEREIELPRSPIEPNEVKAQFKNGFLYVRVPKAKAVFRHTKISIRKI